MLSPSSLVIVRDTLPAVGAAVPEITTVFYSKLFADHPQLLTNLFNRGNQAIDTQQQALAGSLVRQVYEPASPNTTASSERGRIW